MSELPETPILAKPEALLRVPVGLASPLWGFYAGAAASGAAWWWMTRWASPENLEALFGQAASAEAPAPLVEVVQPIIEAVVDAAPQPVEAAEPAAEAVVEPPVLAEPVGGEAAPIAPALAVEAAPETVVETGTEPAAALRPRPRKAEPKAD